MKLLSLNTPGQYQFEPIEGMPDPGLGTAESVIRWGTTVLLISAALLTLFFLIWGGIQWITSGGSKEKVQAAQKKIVYASIGLIVVLVSFMIINIVGSLFGVNFFGT